jgi:hypothetical protein
VIYSKMELIPRKSLVHWVWYVSTGFFELKLCFIHEKWFFIYF